VSAAGSSNGPAFAVRYGFVMAAMSQDMARAVVQRMRDPAAFLASAVAAINADPLVGRCKLTLSHSK
jgi:hypothetical protein